MQYATSRRLVYSFYRRLFLPKRVVLLAQEQRPLEPPTLLLSTCLVLLPAQVEKS